MEINTVNIKAGRGLFLPRLYLLVRTVLRATLRLLAPNLTIIGANRVPQRGATLLVANHMSHADAALVACALQRPVHVMAMSEIMSAPIIGSFCVKIGLISIRRGTPDRVGLTVAETLLKGGKVLLVFPEGQLSPDGKLGPLGTGAAALALRCGIPITPVGISNSAALMPYGLHLPRYTRAPIGLRFGHAISVEELPRLNGRLARRRLTDKIQAALTNLVSNSLES